MINRTYFIPKQYPREMLIELEALALEHPNVEALQSACTLLKGALVASASYVPTGEWSRWAMEVFNWVYADNERTKKRNRMAKKRAVTRVTKDPPILLDT